jgi:RHS repeat-associated protein
MTRRRRPSWAQRAISLALAAGQVLILMPPVEGGTAGASGARPPSRSVPTKVNRTLPRGRAVPLVPAFTAWPSEAEIKAALVFAEPLLAVGGESTLAERKALAGAVTAYARAGRGEDFRPLEAFLAEHPDGRYRPALLANLGLLHREAGRFSRAIESLEEAWRASRGLEGAAAQAVALRALSDLLEIHFVFGHADELRTVLAEVDLAALHGPATERVTLAQEGLWILENKHEEALPSGSTALARVRSVLRPGAPPEPKLVSFPATHDGASLPELEALAAAAGLPMTMAVRSEAAEWPVPSVVHLKVGHFVAVVAREGDRYRVDDPSLQALWGTRWLSADSLADEASGYALVAGPLPPGWRAADAQGAAHVRGKCLPGFPDVAATGRCNTTAKGNCENPGLAGYDVHALLVSVTLNDTPLFYTPPLGPAVRFHVTYSQREYFQPQAFSFSHLGPKWTFDWLSYVVAAAEPWVYLAGGGREDYTLGTPHPVSGAVLVQTSSLPLRYERRLPDGSVEVFGQPMGGAGARVFMTERRDPQGQALTFTYEGSRLIAVGDALGQVTTLAYEDADPLRVTRVTDPFGRSALLDYDGSGRLQSITDVIGLVSRFTYGAGDLVSALETPYGTTRFNAGQTQTFIPKRFAEVIDPLGGREYVESRILAAGGSTTFWDKRAMAMDPLGPSGARVWNWALVPPVVRDMVTSEKRPLEMPVSYLYSPGARRPSMASRFLDDGVQRQVYQWEYNAQGQVTRSIDPEGRETVLEYANNGIDLLQVRQRNGTAFDLLQSTTYNTAHRPLTVTDAAGQTTTFTYTARQQLETVTTPKNETWTLTYDGQGQYLQSMSGPLPGATTGLTWDFYGRVRTLTNADNYTITIDYDALNRPLQVTYPNGTHEDLVWEKLHVRRHRDLQGRWTELLADAMGRTTGVRDPWGRLMALEWCDCGSLSKVIDWKGNATSWDRDIRGRMTRETHADGSSQSVTYETNTSRVKRVTDAKGQTRDYEYFLDDRLKRVTYGNTPVATSPVSLTYDPSHGRLATITDGTGTTTYFYRPITNPPGLGAGQLATIDGPLANDLVSYTYDEVGRALSRSINGAETSVTYDALGRITTAASDLGSFNYGYGGVTRRLASVTGPGSFVRDYAYHDQSQDRMLREIHNRWGSGTVSKFTYDYNAANQITGWTQVAGNGPGRRYELGYGQAGQLASAVLKDMSTGSVLKSYAFGYDPSLNRTAEQAGDAVATASHDVLNQLVTRQAGGEMRFAGFTNEPASVRIQGRSASAAPNNAFFGSAVVAGGPNTVTLTATDGSNNTSSRAYDVTVTGSAATFSHDPNGNLTSDGTRTYTWDAADRLVAIEQGTHRTELQYDGFSRRTRIVEKENGSIVSNQRFMWVGTQLVEERDGTGGVTVKRFYGQGVQIGGQAYFYARDHLGSVRELVDATGAVRARYDYDPYGRRTKVAGDADADFGFTGHYEHAPSGLKLTLYRAYDSSLGRWLSRDPIGLAGGLNRLAYVDNDPINKLDPLGLSWGTFGSGLADGFASGVGWGLVGGLILGAAAGTVLFPFLAAAAIGLAAYGLYQGAQAMWNACSEDEVAFIAGQMIGGTIGGAVGGGAGARAGAAARANFPGARSSSLPSNENLDLPVNETWGRPGTLDDHFARHGADVGAENPAAYAKAASDLLQNSQAQGMPTKIDPQGVIRVYDPSTNTFGSFNPNGTSRTVFCPTNGNYFPRQPGPEF